MKRLREGSVGGRAVMSSRSRAGEGVSGYLRRGGGEEGTFCDVRGDGLGLAVDVDEEEREVAA